MKKLLIAVACAGAALSAQAGVVSSLSDGTVLPMAANGGFGIAPQTLANGVVWSSDGERSVFGYTDMFGFNLNGQWKGMALASPNDDFSTMRLVFDKPVMAVGALFNYGRNYGNATIAAYDASHQLIESRVLQINLPDDSVNQGVFYGFRESTASISYFEMSGAYIGATGFTVLAVPEPSTYAMLLGGLGLLGIAARRRRQ
ncbi:PEP-CTERM sorting domain-containing protein [Pseudoduganella danionis]|uniref:PEPxxWA-CTERM sorting domain-containing protein n=1 Tax=Pseudoduganella danionis TaxID=1890295 RepID=A0ABW9SPG3_9BURK|nr:PEP-CTERM sorting domain-containing protein [Pseudoduganella danionis]MTW33750.1 PEPxxWA-CTERM sorting domain-containing protein [Pseudoduganella danionis]